MRGKTLGGAAEAGPTCLKQTIHLPSEFCDLKNSIALPLLPLRNTNPNTSRIWLCHTQHLQITNCYISFSTHLPFQLTLTLLQENLLALFKAFTPLFSITFVCLCLHQNSLPMCVSPLSHSSEVHILDKPNYLPLLHTTCFGVNQYHDWPVSNVELFFHHCKNISYL